MDTDITTGLHGVVGYTARNIGIRDLACVTHAGRPSSDPAEWSGRPRPTTLSGRFPIHTYTIILCMRSRLIDDDGAIGQIRYGVVTRG